MDIELRYYDSYDKFLCISSVNERIKFRLNTKKENMEYYAEKYNIKYIDISKMDYDEKNEFIENDEYYNSDLC